MDAQTPKEVLPERRFLPALAEAVATWFPELGGRALAVSEVSVTKENIPTLPLAMVAFARSTSEQPLHQRSEMFEIQDAFIIEFWMEPSRYKKANGSETPFWSYYDYEAVRDTLLANITQWETPGGERIAFRGLTIDADPLAVTLSFAFIASFRWCSPVTEFGIPFTISSRLCAPAITCVPTCLEENEDECHPCP